MTEREGGDECCRNKCETSEDTIFCPTYHRALCTFHVKRGMTSWDGIGGAVAHLTLPPTYAAQSATISSDPSCRVTKSYHK